ncbi:MAG: hypothetical protein PVG49_12555 [Desulfobacteraceae bacterium]|jgi:hypothetical protein
MGSLPDCSNQVPCTSPIIRDKIHDQKDRVLFLGAIVPEGVAGCLPDIPISLPIERLRHGAMG